MTDCLLCTNKINTFTDDYYRTPNGNVCKCCGDELFKMTEGFELILNNIIEPEINLKTPKEIYNYLNEYVIGQEDVKKSISIAVYNHYKRIGHNTHIDKSNILLIGPSGSGKTHICKTIAKLLDVPFVICDATTFTQAGYIGEDVESMLTKLYIASDKSINKTEKGIIFIDEIDKIATRPSLGRDAAGLGVQQALLKFLEGSKVSVPVSLNKQEKDIIEINTENILFVCSGAFVNLLHFDTDNLVSFGLIPELIGRLPIRISTEKLSVEDIRKILTEPKDNIISQYKELFKIDKIDLSFSEDSLQLISEVCYNDKLGIRGLKTTLEKILKEPMFELPGSSRKRLNIKKEYITNVLNLNS